MPKETGVSRAVRVWLSVDISVLIGAAVAGCTTREPVTRRIAAISPPKPAAGSDPARLPGPSAGGEGASPADRVSDDVDGGCMSSLLEVRDLVAGFGKSFRVGPVNLDIKQGILHLSGPNGSGKSTLLRAMSGELLPSAGQVVVMGQDVHRTVEARRQIALVPSTSELPDFLSVAEAYEFTASIRGAHEWNGARFCEELKLDPGLRLGNASEGERQKAELICGLAGDPPILLLDETFTHLDNDSSHRLREWIVEWASSRLIMITHHGALPVPANATLSVDEGKVTFRRSCESFQPVGL